MQIKQTKQTKPEIADLVSVDPSLRQAEPVISRLLLGLSSVESCDSSLRFREARKGFERAYFANLLQMTGGNVSEAARLSGLARQNFYAHLKRLAIVTES